MLILRPTIKLTMTIVCIIFALGVMTSIISMLNASKKNLLLGHVVMIEQRKNPTGTMPGALCFAEVLNHMGFGYYSLQNVHCKYRIEETPGVIWEPQYSQYGVPSAFIHEQALQEVYYRDDKLELYEQDRYGNSSHLVFNKFDTAYFPVRGIDCYASSLKSLHCQNKEHELTNWYVKIAEKFNKIEYPIGDKILIKKMWAKTFGMDVEIKEQQ